MLLVAHHCLFYSLEGGSSYFHTWFDIGAYFKFPGALRIIGKTASSEPGTENVIGIINYQMERSGEFFIILLLKTASVAATIKSTILSSGGATYSHVSN